MRDIDGSVSSRRRFGAIGAAVLAFSVVQGARAADAPAPTVAKDSVRVRAAQVSAVYKGGKRTPGASWLPAIAFRVNGPIANGSQITVEFSLPGGKPWVKYACFDVVSDVDADWFWKTACGALPTDRMASVKEEQSTTVTGVVSFDIKIANELAGTKATLFSGKAKVDKILERPKQPDSALYFVDDDWRLPMGYVGFESGAGRQMPGASYRGNDSHVLVAAMEFHGNPGEVKGALFYQGKQLGLTLCRGGENSELNVARPEWSEVECKFTGVFRGEIPAGEGEAPNHLLAKSPGPYEVKVTSGGHLARSIKFTVAADGALETGVPAAGKLGSGRALVPVQILGDAGKWDKEAWKTGAFYGNPVAGFAAP